MTTTQIWRLIEEWRDAQLFPVSQAALAEKIGISRSAISQWKNGQARPTPAKLRALSDTTRIPYENLLDALLADMGYLTDAGTEFALAADPMPPGGTMKRRQTSAQDAAGEHPDPPGPSEGA